MATPNKMKLHRLGLWFYLATAALIAVALIATIVYLGPFPPDVVIMTTGAPGSEYEGLGRRYQAVLARAGVQLRLAPSAGSVENLERLMDPHSGISVGFVQGGLVKVPSSSLVSLGTLAYEPVWFFHQGVAPGRHLEGLRGHKFSIGPEGSGGHEIALALLKLNGIDSAFAELLPLTAAEAGERILRREISAALMVASWDMPTVRRLLADPQIDVASFPRAEAYVALYPFLTKLVLPAGAGNMAKNRPPSDINLIALKTSLIVRGDMHPAIQYLLLHAAAEIHSGPGLFHKPGRFPALEQIDYPLSEVARQYYKSGRPFLQRYLPFWLAVFAGQLLVLMIPVVGVAYPLLRVAPALYGWSMRRRIFQLYGELKLIEVELEAVPPHKAGELLERLELLERHANHMRVPVSFAHFLYTLRHHINLVRARLERSA